MCTGSHIPREIHMVQTNPDKSKLFIHLHVLLVNNCIKIAHSHLDFVTHSAVSTMSMCLFVLYQMSFSSYSCVNLFIHFSLQCNNILSVKLQCNNILSISLQSDNIFALNCNMITFLVIGPNLCRDVKHLFHRFGFSYE